MHVGLIPISPLTLTALFVHKLEEMNLISSAKRFRTMIPNQPPMKYCIGTGIYNSNPSCPICDDIRVFRRFQTKNLH